MDKIIFWRDNIVIWMILRAFPASCRFIRHSLVKLVPSCIKSFSFRCNITWQRYSWIPPNWPPSWIYISKAAPEHHNLRDLLQDRCISFSEVSLKSGCRVHEHNPQRGGREAGRSVRARSSFWSRGSVTGHLVLKTMNFWYNICSGAERYGLKIYFFLYMLHFSVLWFCNAADSVRSLS